MKYFQILLLTSLMFFSQYSQAQNRFLSKVYLEVNTFEHTTPNFIFNYGNENRVIKLFPTIELGFQISDRLSLELGYTNKNQNNISLDDVQGWTGKHVTTGYECFVGLEYYPFQYNRFQFGLQLDGFYRYEDQYFKVPGGIIISSTEGYSQISTYGISYSLQSKIEITKNFSVVIGSGVSNTRFNSEVTPLDFTNWPKKYYSGLRTEINLLNRLALRFNF